MLAGYLGKLGSGKTVSGVVAIVDDTSGRPTYTNITPKKKVAHWKQLKPTDMLRMLETERKERKDGSIEVKYKPDINWPFWAKHTECKNIVLDEIHLQFNSKRAQTEMNMVFDRFVAMGRRFTKTDQRGYGKFIFIAQNIHSITKDVRLLLNEIRYHIMHWHIRCKNCGLFHPTSSEELQYDRCPLCHGFDFAREGFWQEIFVFDSVQQYMWFDAANLTKKTWKLRLYNRKIADYFSYYDTHQIDDLWKDFLEKRIIPPQKKNT